MDLLTVAVAGASGAFVKEFCSKSVSWLIELVAAQSPNVKQKTEQNLKNFVQRLAKRVELLEAELPPEGKAIFDDALASPRTSLLLRDVMVSAATTESDERHEILSELIAQRLTADEEDLIALVGAASCDLINALAIRHIWLLGMLARLYSIRPSDQPEIRDDDEYHRYLLSWWRPLVEFLPRIADVTNFDIQHLAGLSCVTISIGKTNIGKLLELPVRPNPLKLDMAVFEKEEWWSEFKAIWEKGCANVTLTSTGNLIGVLHHDSCLRAKTSIDWK